MAKEKSAAPKLAGGKAEKTGKRSGKKTYFLIAFGMGILLLFMLPTFLLVLIGMTPTYIALFADKDPDKAMTSAVAAMNFAGIVPFIIDLWVMGQNTENVMHMLADPMTWLVMLGAAGIGRLIVFAVPQVVATLTLIRAETRLKLLKKNLDSLRQRRRHHQAAQ